MPIQFTLTDTMQNPKIFRTLIVPSKSCFTDLEEFISIAFDITHMDSFYFEMTKSNGKTIQPVFIGTDMAGDLLFTDDELEDDEEELLKDWFKQEGDAAAYHIPALDIELAITVDKILPNVVSQPCPACIAGKGDLHSGKLEFVDIHGISEMMKFVDAITEEDLLELLEDEDLLEVLEKTESMQHLLEEHSDEPDYKGLLELATSLKNAKPWEYILDDEIFLIEHPFTNDLIFVSVLGAAGQEFGLTLYLNDRGYETLHTIFTGAEPTKELMYELESLAISFVDREELSKKDYQLIKDAGFSYRGKKNWIQFRTYDPGQFPWLPDAEGVEILQLASIITLEHIEAIKSGWIYPDLPENCFPIYHVNEESGEWERTIAELPPIPKNRTHENYLDLPKEFVQKLRSFQKAPLEVELDISYTERAIQETKDERPFYPLLAVAVDKKTGMVIYHELLPVPMEPGLAQSVFVNMLKTLELKPKAVHVTKDIASYIKPIAQLTGNTLKTSNLPAIKRFYQEFDI